MGREESTKIEAGNDLVEGRTLLDDPRRRNEERDPDKTARLSSLDDPNDSVSESDGTLAGSFWACLLLCWRLIVFHPLCLELLESVPILTGVWTRPSELI